MSDRTQLLRIALVVFGAIFCLIYPLSIVWPAGWSWHMGTPYSNDYFMMIVGVYATLGVFLILAARDPAANRSLILFTAVSSLVHAAIMAVQAIQMPEHMGHMYGDIPGLVAVAVVLYWLLPPARPAAG
ncbi:MAG: DUF6632 domain-containing protein [Rhizomicrobium sp.]